MADACDHHNEYRYLQIGCTDGGREGFGSLSRAGWMGSPLEVAVCVDPIQGGTNGMMTSDEFFATNTQVDR